MTFQQSQLDEVPIHTKAAQGAPTIQYFLGLHVVLFPKGPSIHYLRTLGPFMTINKDCVDPQGLPYLNPKALNPILIIPVRSP